MSHEQRGKYISLLCYQHQLGHLTEQQMIDVCGTHDVDIFDKFVKDDQGLYYNERLEEESIKRKSFCESRKKSRSFGKRRTSNVRESYVERTENENKDANAALKEQPNTTKRALKQGIDFNFEDIWSLYPKRVGKKDALRHFKDSVKTEKDHTDIHDALINYKASERVFNGFIQNGSTWFNNWRDWIDYKENACQKCKGKGKFTSTTGYEVVCDCPRGKNP